MEEFYIGQIFEGEYPPEAAEWCNERGDCYIEEIDALNTIRRFQIVEVPQETEEERKKRIDRLSMTKREMFLGLYQAKGITPDMLKARITDSQALIEFEYANDYFRGNPLIDDIGTQLGFTSEQLNKFFETKDYHYLEDAAQPGSAKLQK